VKTGYVATKNILSIHVALGQACFQWQTAIAQEKPMRTVRGPSNIWLSNYSRSDLKIMKNTINTSGQESAQLLLLGKESGIIVLILGHKQRNPHFTSSYQKSEAATMTPIVARKSPQQSANRISRKTHSGPQSSETFRSEQEKPELLTSMHANQSHFALCAQNI